MANEGSTKPTVNGFCEKHQPNQAVQYAGCWVCLRNEDTEMLREVLRAFGWMKDKEAGWYLAGDADDCPKFYDFHDAVAAALDDYDGLREAHKKAHLYGAGQKVRADKLESENLRVRGLHESAVEANIGMRRETEKLTAELARMRGLLQRQYQKDVVLGLLQRIGANHNLEYCDCEFCQFRSEFYKLLVPSSAESVDIGKLDTADTSGVEMGKVNSAPHSSMVEPFPYKGQVAGSSPVAATILNELVSAIVTYLVEMSADNLDVLDKAVDKSQAWLMAGSAETGGEKADV